MQDEHLEKISSVSIRKNTSNTTEEVENMVRRAGTLKSLDELNLSARTKTCLNRKFGSIEDIIWEGRMDAYAQDLGIQLKDEAPKWKSELISALTDAGFIRPSADFLRTFRINAFYCTMPAGLMALRLKELYGTEEWIDYSITDIWQLSNKQYEDFEDLSSEVIEEVKASWRSILTEREYEILCLRFGLDCTRIPRDLETTGKQFGITRERVRQIEAKAIGKLGHPRTKLPAIYEAPDDLKKTLRALSAELEELYKNPVFERASYIAWLLEYLKEGNKESPFKYTRKLDDTPIYELNLSARAHRCLGLARIWTIADIVNLPKDDWSKVRGLGSKSLEDVVEKMHAAGYKEFNV